VSVSRNDLSNGYQWLITFDGCKIVNGSDVCNLGDVALLGVNNTLLTCGSSQGSTPISVSQVVQGSGPADCAEGPCFGYVTDMDVY
jgi:hypothetical protein